jgi:hypothetical protein
MYVLKKIEPGGGRWIVIQPGVENTFNPTATRNPDPGRAYATRLSADQAQKWQAVLGGPDKIDIKAA